LNDAKGFIEYIFWKMTVFNESSVNALIPDLIEYNNRLITSKFEINLIASYEFMELLSNLPNILELILDNGIKFYFSPDIETIEKYFNLPNFELTSQIIHFDSKLLLLNSSKSTVPKRISVIILAVTKMGNFCNKPLEYLSKILNIS
jgi:hypothetical protein